MIQIELSTYQSKKNHYALFKKLHVFLGKHNKNFVCRRCLNSYTNENAFINLKKNVEMIIFTL